MRGYIFGCMLICYALLACRDFYHLTELCVCRFNHI